MASCDPPRRWCALFYFSCASRIGEGFDEPDHGAEPAGCQPGRGQPLAPRVPSLDGITLGILNNSKPNSLELQRDLVELLGQRHRVAGSITKQKPSAAIGADGLDAYAKEVGAVVTAISD